MVPLKRIIPIGIEMKMLGEEFKWNDPTEKREMTPIRAFNFYNSLCDEKQAKSFVLYYAHSILKDKGLYETLSKVPDVEFFGPHAWLCRMKHMGYDMTEIEETSVAKKIAYWKTRATQTSKKKIVAVKFRDKIDEAIDAKISEIDFQIDEFVGNGFKTNFNPYEWMKTNEIKPMYATRIQTIFSKQLKELKEAQTGSDEQLVEAYSFISNSSMKKFIAFVQKIVDDAEVWASSQKKLRAPRKKKTKSADQLTKNVRYQKTDDELRLVSLDPSKLIGAKEIWLFNTKYRVLSKYVAADESGMTIKGTTLQNFSEKESVGKKIRKPEEISKNVVTGGIRSVSKYFSTIKAKESSCNGRLNENTIILRVA